MGINITEKYRGLSDNRNINLAFLDCEMLSSEYKYYVLRGGVMSGKSYAIFQYLKNIIDSGKDLNIAFLSNSLPIANGTIQLWVNEFLGSKLNAFNKPTTFNNCTLKLITTDGGVNRGSLKGCDLIICDDADYGDTLALLDCINKYADKESKVIFALNGYSQNDSIRDKIEYLDNTIIVNSSYKDNISNLTNRNIEYIESLDGDIYKKFK